MGGRPFAAASALFAAGAFFGISFSVGGGWQWALLAALACAALLWRRRRGLGWLLCALALGLLRGAVVASVATDPQLADAAEPLLIEGRTLSSDRGKLGARQLVVEIEQRESRVQASFEWLPQPIH